jgi:hypothetical protein
MLSGTYLYASITIEMMHAFLCLSLWLVLKLRLWKDPYLGYIGLVLNSAMQLNCHSPPSPLLNSKLRRNASRRAMPDVGVAVRDTTWLACFDISTRYVIFRLFTRVTSTRSATHMEILPQTW